MKNSILVMVLATVSLSVFANPGRYQINQACINVGCFSGDDPTTSTIEITQFAGTFILTSNIIVNDAENGAPAILVAAPTVQGSVITIDLNGYEIAHTGTPSSSTNGIQVDGFNSIVTIRNGKIRTFFDAIQARDNATVIVENMIFRNQFDDAIEASRAVVRNNTFNGNAYGVNSSSNAFISVDASIYLDSNFFSNINGAQDAVFFSGNNSYCKDNVIAYDDFSQFGGCFLAGDNMCGSSACTVQ